MDQSETRALVTRVPAETKRSFKMALLRHHITVQATLAAFMDVFIDQDSPAVMYAKAGLDAKGIVKRVFEALGRENEINAVQLA